MGNIVTKRIKTYAELDEILPMVEAFHKTQPYCKLFPHSGYLAWLTTSFPFLGIWVGYEVEGMVGVPKGYIIVAIQITNSIKEAVIYEAYSEIGDLDITRKAFEKASEWAKEQGCTLISFFTEHPRVEDLCIKRYGFEVSRTYLTKELK